MTKLCLIPVFALLLIFISCNLTSGQKFKAETDKEFDKGSKIVLKDVTERTIEDLSLLGKIWGFLKYYHQEIASGNYRRIVDQHSSGL